jgi:hypothetical protein
MATITFDNAITLPGTYKVFTKATWGDSWSENDKIQLRSVVFCAGPSIPTASFTYRYGPAIERTAAGPATRNKLAIVGHWIRVELDLPNNTKKQWVGFVDNIAESEQGFVLYGGNNVATGLQTFTASGGVQALAFARMDRTFFLRLFSSTTTIEKGLTPPVFNAFDRGESRPRYTREISKTAGQNSFAHVFSHIYGRSRFEYKPWSTRDIAEHLIDRYLPRNSSDTVEITFAWKTGALARLPDNDEPFLDCTGMSLLDALNAVILPRNLYGWTCDFNLASNRFDLDIFTFNQASVTLGTFTVPANANQHHLKLIADPATTFSTQLNTASFYHQVVARGAPRRCVATIRTRYLSADGSPMHYGPGWDSELDSRSTTKVSAITGDSSLSRAEKAERLSELYDSPEFRDFNVLFRPDGAWNYQIGGEKIFEDEDGSAYWPAPHRVRILDDLPLSAAQDYTAGIAQTVAGVSPITYLPIQVFGEKMTSIKEANPDINTFIFHASDKIYWGDRARRTYYNTPLDPPFSITAEPVLGSPLGIRYLVEGASSYQIKTKSILAYSEYIPHLPSMNCNRLMATVCFEEDRLVEKRWPSTTPTGKDALRRLYIENPNFHYVRVLAGTVLFTNNTVHTVATTAFYRDDRTKLEDLAKRMAEWFTNPRRILSLRSLRCSELLDVGHLVDKLEPTTTVEQTIKTVVTQITFSFADRASIELETQSAELDPISFLPPPPVV